MSPFYTKARIEEYFRNIGCTSFNSFPQQASSVLLVLYSRYRFSRVTKLMSITQNETFKSSYAAHSQIAAYDVQTPEGWQMAQMLSATEYPVMVLLALPRYVDANLHPNYVPFCMVTIGDIKPKRLSQTLDRIISRGARGRSDAFNEGTRLGNDGIPRELAEEIDQLQTDLAVALSRREMEHRETGVYAEHDADLELTVSQLNNALRRAGEPTISLSAILSGETNGGNSDNGNADRSPQQADSRANSRQRRNIDEMLPLLSNDDQASSSPLPMLPQTVSSPETDVTARNGYRLIDRTKPGRANIIVPLNATIMDAVTLVSAQVNMDPFSVTTIIIGNTEVDVRGNQSRPLSEFMLQRNSIPVTLRID